MSTPITKADRIATEAAKAYEKLDRADIIPTTEQVSYTEADLAATATAMAQARHEAGLDPTTHDPDFMPVMIATPVALRLLKETMRRRLGKEDDLFPGQIANLAVLMFVQKLEANDPELEAYLPRLRAIGKAARDKRKSLAEARKEKPIKLTTLGAAAALKGTPSA
jgi:hypothetical protein